MQLFDEYVDRRTTVSNCVDIEFNIATKDMGALHKKRIQVGVPPFASSAGPAYNDAMIGQTSLRALR
jgi:hypothetical protein